MKPLRPHNYYGGTTCPGRATGQVGTIRSLIPEEDDMGMTPEEKELYDKQLATIYAQIDAIRTALLQPPQFNPDAAVWDSPLTKAVREHAEDMGRHLNIQQIRDNIGPRAGGGGIDDARAREIAQDEDRKLQVTKPSE